MEEELLDNLTEVDEIRCVLNLYNKAKTYLENFDWCIETKKAWYEKNFSFYDKIGVFLFEIEPLNENVDDFIWVVVGDLPSVYLDKSVSSGMEAIEIYCELMEEWIENIKNGKSVEECYPVPNEPTIKNAKLLKSRIEFIRTNFLNAE